MNSVLPAVVGDEEKLVQANSIWSQMDALSFVLGPALGGVLALLGAPQLAFLINGATFLISAATLLFVRIPPQDAPQETGEEGEAGWLSETLAGFRFLLKENESVLAALTLSIVSLTLVGGAFWTLTVVLADEAFGLGSQAAGFLSAAYGAGGLLGGIAAGTLSSKVRLAPAFIWSVTASALIFVVLGLAPAGVLPFLLLLVIGAIDIVAEVNYDGMGRPRDDKDVAQELACELADIAAQLGSLKGEANVWLSAPEYDALRHRLEDAHASVVAAAVEARRRVRLNEGRER